jgi:hypothetical protein
MRTASSPFSEAPVLEATPERLHGGRERARNLLGTHSARFRVNTDKSPTGRLS